MDRQADTVTFIASVRPETTAAVLDSARDLKLFFHVSRSILDGGNVKAEYRDAVEELKAVFVDKIAMRHVKDYAPRLARSGQSWAGSTALPMTAAATARMEGSSPPDVIPSRTVAAIPGPSAVVSPHDADNIFSPRGSHAQPAPRCDACREESTEPEAEDYVVNARARVAQLARRSLITGFDVKPLFPVELAIQIGGTDQHFDILSMLHTASGDAKLMLALLESLGFCDRHAFKLVAAAVEDLAHGFRLSA